MKKEDRQNRQDKEKKVNRAASRVSRACRDMCMPLLFGLLCVASDASLIAQADEGHELTSQLLSMLDNESSDSGQPTEEVKGYRAAEERGLTPAQNNSRD